MKYAEHASRRDKTKGNISTSKSAAIIQDAIRRVNHMKVLCRQHWSVFCAVRAQGGLHIYLYYFCTIAALLRLQLAWQNYLGCACVFI
jgi:hypothetical protein